jgi:hypothetical protein
MTAKDKLYMLLDTDGRPYTSTTPGALGGHRRNKLYGRLDCPAALRALAAGDYVRNRVFFADEQTAVSAGYRPCAVCLPTAYKLWKANR